MFFYSQYYILLLTVVCACRPCTLQCCSLLVKLGYELLSKVDKMSQLSLSVYLEAMFYVCVCVCVCVRVFVCVCVYVA